MIKIGCCGFPESMKRYFNEFCVIELQNTFYKLPQITTAQKWREMAPPTFQFCMKAHQAITHEISSPTWRRSGLKEDELRKLKDKVGFFKQTLQVCQIWERTKEIAENLGAKIIVFQCPASFKPEKKNIENLRIFFKKIKDEKFTFIWEPRGEWDKELIKKLCQELNLVHCVDPFKQKSIWGKINYFRLHGRPEYNLRYKYTNNDLKELLNFCDKKENYVLFNNLSMLNDALRFKKLCK